MDIIKQNLGWLVVISAFLIFGTAFALSAMQSEDTDTSKNDNSSTEQANSDKKNAPSPSQADQQSAPKPYSYVAQAGDSYAVLARKAVQTYGINNKVTLSLAQIVAAETHLTLDAGSPYLEVGQTVSLDADAVKAAAESVQKISAEEVAQWNVYVPEVEFNTNSYGQAV